MKTKQILLNIGKLKKFFLFALVGGFGTVLNTLILYLLSQKVGMNYLIAAAIATEIAIISNFIGNNYLTFKNQNKNEKLYKKFLSFQLISLVTLIGTIFFLWVFVTLFGENLLLIWNLIAIIIMFVVNFMLNLKFTWQAKDDLKYKKKKNIFDANLHVFLSVLFGISVLFTILLAQSYHALNSTQNQNITLESNATIPTFNLSYITNSTDQNITQDIINSTTINTTTIKDVNSTNQTIINQTNLTNSTINNLTLESNNTKEIYNLTYLALAKANETANSTNSTQNNSAIGDIVAISQLGYHTSSIKQVVVYTNSLTGTFNIRDSSSNSIMANFPLKRPTNYLGMNVNCQGNMPCLIGDFTNFTAQGVYYIEENGIRSPTFPINKNIFSSTIPIFFEFFNAQLQQDSSYHADIHSGYSLPFTSISDGSFIMEADQAALSLIRLGSAYRRNPQLFQFNKYNILATGKPDIQEYSLIYVDYLKSLQGVSIQEGNNPGAVRLGTGMLINNIFIPGPTNLTTMDVYIPGSPPTLLQSASVVSLCGANDGTNKWQTCINNAATIYKCQIDEPCLNLTYNDRIGRVTSNVITNGYAVSQGWGYEFGCYFDVNLDSGNFNNGNVNPCQIFHNTANRQYTSMTLLAFLEAWPAVNDFSQLKGQELLTRSINTYNYIKTNYPSFAAGDSDSGFYGTSLFLLYDYTNNTAYLREAYNLRNTVSITFISDATRGNEFYWEEYSRHKNAINSLGLAYQLNGVNPEEFFRGKIFQDYKDAGPTAISNNGERVFQFDPNIQFQNSRYMVIEGLLGMKTIDLVSSPEYFIPIVAQNQLSWLTGMNLIQQGVGFNSEVKSMSFIFGIGNFPTQFHSRWLVDTGYSSLTSGSFIGARGTGYQFFDTVNNSYVYLDGVANILGYRLGALGNNWNNEQHNDPFQVGTVFNNGVSYIPGWINGAFPASADGDTIFNYKDNLNTYEYTETTNEIVATTIEYYAYLDGKLNNRPRYNGNAGNFTLPPTNTTLPPNLTQSNLKIFTNPGTVKISINSIINATSDANGLLILQNLTPGNNLLIATKTNFTTFSSQINLLPGNNSINITLVPLTINPPVIPPNLSAKIISNSTSLIPTRVNGLMQYSMREDASASFSVTSDMNNSITWFIDGVEQNTTFSKSSVFTFNPGILWVPRAPDYSNILTSNIRAQSATESVSWNVKIENVINPFFSNKDDGGDILGSVDSKVRVITNNKYISFTEVNVTISNGNGDIVYQLIKKFADSNETEWAIYIPQLAYGNNYLTKVVGFNNITHNNLTYNLGLARAHYVTPPTSNPPSGGNSGGSGNIGGGSSSRSFNPELIYALFEKNVLSMNDYQTLTLDAKDFNGGVYQVQANIINPEGNTEIFTLNLVNGTRDYGTWTARFQINLTGQYKLDSVRLIGSDSSYSEEINIQDHTFYSTDQNTNVTETLGLIYAILSQNRVNNGTSVDITLDARDTKGVLEVTARINSTKGDNILVDLKLVNGNNLYGTWKGSFIVAKPGVTYSINNITLKSSDDQKSYILKDRSVYVFLPVQNQTINNRNFLNEITGFSVQSFFSRENLADTVKKPLFPTLLGFGLMFLVVGSIFLVKRNK